MPQTQADRVSNYRRTASYWHGGQFSPLYAFASTGSIIPGLEREVRERIHEADDQRLYSDATKLRNLLNHVIRTVGRGF